MKKIILFLLFLLSIQLVSATVNLEVTAFNCSPDEVTITEDFSCTATIENSGDETGSLSTATLYPDSSNWLESSSYAEAVNTNINSGASADVIFEGLRAQKSGEYGFSRITLDEASDTYPADNSVEVNVIDIVTVVSQSANSATASTGTVDGSAQVTVGGSLDLVLSFSVVSGGCGIGTQASSASFSDLSDGQSVSQTWTITMGTSNCVYTISSQATSNPSGIGTKTDSTTKTITCSGSSCTSSSSSSSSSSSGSSGASGGAGGGGGGTTKTSTSEEDEEDTPHQAPEYTIDEKTIDLDNDKSWKNSGKTTLENLPENQTITFTFVTSSLEEQDWILIIESIDLENNQVVLFMKQEGQEATEIRVFLAEGMDLDLDKDGIIDVTIHLEAIQEGTVTLSFEKSTTFLAQEQLLVEQTKGKGLVISLLILFFILAIGTIYFFTHKKLSVKKEEVPSKEYYKQKKEEKKNS